MFASCGANDAGSKNAEPAGGLSGDYAADSKGAVNSDNIQHSTINGPDQNRPLTGENGVDSVYTSLSEQDCETIEANDEGEWSVGECRGTSGYKLEVMEGDLRQTINVVAPSGKRYELNLWSVVSSAFSSVGEKAEWRVRAVNGELIPFALIVRYNVNEDPENPARTTSYLTVSKITADSICVTDIVKPVGNANVEARKRALSAGESPCLKAR